MIFPGPGIGGYCLPKDGGLGMWAYKYKHIFGWEDDIFKVTPVAVDINDTRSLHPPQLVRDALRNMGKPLAAADVLLLGASYREDVGDTRYSGSEASRDASQSEGQNATPSQRLLQPLTDGLEESAVKLVVRAPACGEAGRAAAESASGWLSVGICMLAVSEGNRMRER